MLVDAGACDERAMITPAPAPVGAEGFVDRAFDDVYPVYFYAG